MKTTTYLAAAGLIGLAACASGGGAPQLKWSASSWNGLAPQTIGTQNFNFFAAPLDGQGFKLKLSLVTDGSFRIQDAGASLPDELETAAREAAPEGCTFTSLTRTEDGGAEPSTIAAEPGAGCGGGFQVSLGLPRPERRLSPMRLAVLAVLAAALLAACSPKAETPAAAAPLPVEAPAALDLSKIALAMRILSTFRASEEGAFLIISVVSPRLGVNIDEAFALDAAEGSDSAFLASEAREGLPMRPGRRMPRAWRRSAANWYASSRRRRARTS